MKGSFLLPKEINQAPGVRAHDRQDVSGLEEDAGAKTMNLQEENTLKTTLTSLQKGFKPFELHQKVGETCLPNGDLSLLCL